MEFQFISNAVAEFTKTVPNLKWVKTVETVNILVKPHRVEVTIMDEVTVGAKCGECFGVEELLKEGRGEVV